MHRSTTRLARLKALVALAWLFMGVAAVALTSPLAGQRLPVGDVDESYLRVLQISGLTQLENSFLLRPLSWAAASESLLAADSHPWSGRLVEGRKSFGSVDVVTHASRFRLLWAPDFASEENLGALHPERGFTAALDGGVSVRSGPLTVSARPLVAYAQNVRRPLAMVEVQGQSEFAYPWWRIDLPQRFGPDPYWTVDPGQSEVRLDASGASVSFGTTNLWWGPGIRNAILLSNNAAGVPHVSLETRRPLHIGESTVEAQWIWGRLQQSDWFDSTFVDPGRFLTGANIVFTPGGSVLKGLSLGLARMFYGQVPEAGVGSRQVLLVGSGQGNGNDGRDGLDQLVSFSARWVFPESGFEGYMEWARNDRGEHLRDYFVNWEHSQLYTLGFQKATQLLNQRILVLRGELTHLERSSSRLLRATPVYGAHGEIPQGYTQKGQMIGAFIGPGGNAQFLGADLYAPWGGASFFVQRRVHDQDAYMERADQGQPGWYYWDIHTSGLVGSSLTLFRGPWDVSGRFSFERHFNQNFKSDHDAYRVDLSARWRAGWAPGG